MAESVDFLYALQLGYRRIIIAVGVMQSTSIVAISDIGG